MTVAIDDKEQRKRREGVVREGYKDTTHGTEFVLEYVFMTDHWGIRVIGRPPTNRPLPAAVVHLLPGNYVCVAHGREPKTFAQAQARAMQWMRGFSVYVRTGRFEEVSGPVYVPD